MMDQASALVDQARRQEATSLSLSGLHLRVLPSTGDSIQLAALRSLTISKNALSVLPASLSALPALTALDASFNAIGALEGDGAWLCRLGGLTNLNLMANRLETMPEVPLGALTNLVSLGLKTNRLTSLPSTIGKLTKLVHLFLTDNLLTTLPLELTGTGVPEGLEAMVELEFVRLSCNRLTSWPSIARAPKMSWVALAGNPITDGCVRHRSPPLPAAPLVPAPPSFIESRYSTRVEWEAAVQAATPAGSLTILGDLGAVAGASGRLERCRLEGRSEEVVLKTFLVDAAAADPSGQPAYVSPDGRPEDELAAASYVRHSRIVRPLALVDVGGAASGKKGLVMARAAGRVLGGVHSFSSVLRPPTVWGGATISAPWLAACFGDVAAALSHMHAECSMAHGDVFAHNVLVEEASGRATLCDFGAAFFYDRTGAHTPPFEAAEVRALGILLHAFLARSPRLDAATATAAYSSMGTLADECTSDCVSARPTFASVATRLGAVEAAVR